MVKPRECQICGQLADCYPPRPELSPGPIRLTPEDMRHEIHLRGMARFRADLLRARAYVRQAEKGAK